MTIKQGLNLCDQCFELSSGHLSGCEKYYNPESNGILPLYYVQVKYVDENCWHQVALHFGHDKIPRKIDSSYLLNSISLARVIGNARLFYLDLIGNDTKSKNGVIRLTYVRAPIYEGKLWAGVIENQKNKI